MYDYLLGGIHNFAADREAAQAISTMFPIMPLAAKTNRAFLRRSVRYLTGLGIKQFLDIGSGIPTVGNVHEVVQESIPDGRVVYVDIDPVAVAESLDILDGNAQATAVRGDVRDPEGILTHPKVEALLDFDRPVALLLVAMMHFVPDDEEAYAAVARLKAALATGSHLVMTHGLQVSFDRLDEPDIVAALDVYKRQTTSRLKLRTSEEFTQFFDGLKLVDPGVVWVPSWRPAEGDPDDFADDPSVCAMLAAVGVRV
jgi:SAM-dependent methyltransferase